MIRRLLAILLIFGLRAPLLAQPGTPVQAQTGPEGLIFKAHGALGELYRAGLPAQLVVEVTNGHADPIDVVVRSQGQGARGPCAQANLTLAGGTRHSIPLLVPNAGYGQMEVSLEAHGRTGPPLSLSPNMVDGNNELLALTLSPRSTEFQYLTLYKKFVPNKTELRLTRPSNNLELPTLWQAYAGMDLVVLYDRPGVQLSPEAEQALVDWTLAGGSLVLVSNLDPGEYQGRPLSQLLPMQPQRVVSQGPRSYLAGTPQQASLLLSQDGQPLLLEGKRSAGRVFLVTTPVPTQKELGLQRTEELWKCILQHHAEGETWSKQRFNDTNLLLTHPPELPMPSTAALAWYLIGYVLLVGPINYGILRKRDRMLYVVFTVPCISMVFTVGAYWYNSMGRSAQTVLREVGLARVVAGSDLALVDTTMLLFSPRRTTYNVAFPASCYGRGRGMNYGYNNPEEFDFHLVLEPPGTVMRDCATDMWSAHHFRGLDLHQLKSAVQFRLDRGQAVVESPLSLSGCQIVSKAGASKVFQVEAGHKLVQSVSIDPAQPHPGFKSWVGPQLQASVPLLASCQQDDADALGAQVEDYMSSAPVLVGWCQTGLEGSILVNEPGALRHHLMLVAVKTAQKDER